jgi:uncharacterized membrane protein
LGLKGLSRQGPSCCSTYPRLVMGSCFTVCIGTKLKRDNRKGPMRIFLVTFLLGAVACQPASRESQPAARPSANAPPLAPTTMAAAPTSSPRASTAQTATVNKANAQPAGRADENCYSVAKSNEVGSTYAPRVAPFAECAATLKMHCGEGGEGLCSYDLDIAATTRVRKTTLDRCCYAVPKAQ